MRAKRFTVLDPLAVEETIANIYANYRIPIFGQEKALEVPNKVPRGFFQWR